MPEASVCGTLHRLRFSSRASTNEAEKCRRGWEREGGGAIEKVGSGRANGLKEGKFLGEFSY